MDANVALLALLAKQLDHICIVALAISLGRGVVDYCASSTALLDIETLLQKWVLSFQKKTRKLQAALYACATLHPVMSY